MGAGLSSEWSRSLSSCFGRRWIVFDQSMASCLGGERQGGEADDEHAAKDETGGT